MTERPEQRIGTTERERAAERLAENLRAGRLEMDEYDERVQQAYAARTASDLQPLFADLPAEQALRPTVTGRRLPRPSARVLFVVLAVLAFGALAFVGPDDRGGHGGPPFFPLPLPLVLFAVWFVVHRRRHWAHR